MSSSKRKLDYNRANDIAWRIRAELKGACIKIEIAGSIRREKPEVGDIEIVAIPKLSHDLFGDPRGASYVDRILAHMAAESHINILKSGDRYKQFIMPGSLDWLKVDLFLANPYNWGLIYALRTGPALYSKKLVTQRRKGGLLDNDYRIAQGHVWHISDGMITEVPEERDFFRYIAGGWQRPQDRQA